MLNDLNPKDFRNIYIVCGFTDYPRRIIIQEVLQKADVY